MKNIEKIETLKEKDLAWVEGKSVGNSVLRAEKANEIINKLNEIIDWVNAQQSAESTTGEKGK